MRIDGTYPARTSRGQSTTPTSDPPSGCWLSSTAQRLKFCTAQMSPPGVVKKPQATLAC